jgi:hypothetical protein
MSSLDAAHAAHERAAAELYRATVLQDLSQTTGLVYRSLSGSSDNLGPFAVVVDGSLVGDVRRHGDGALWCWRAHPLDGEGEFAPADHKGRGPYPTARAAAASFIDRQGPTATQ